MVNAPSYPLSVILEHLRMRPIRTWRFPVGTENDQEAPDYFTIKKYRGVKQAAPLDVATYIMLTRR